MTFELWEVDTGYSLISVPNPSRWSVLQEPGARLQLRIEAPNPQAAKRIYERFAYRGNPDHLTPIDKPAEEFLLRAYPCGFLAGDPVTFRKTHQVRFQGQVVDEYPEGLEAEILPADSEMPKVVWLRMLGDGEAFSMPEDDACECLVRSEKF